MSDELYIEISKREITRLGTLQKAIINLSFTVWSHDRIKGAFNDGHGTEKDFNKYMQDNKQFCVFKKYPLDFIKRITEKYNNRKSLKLPW